MRLTESSFLYAMAGVGKPQIKDVLEWNKKRVMDKVSSDDDPEFTRIGGGQYHHFTLSVPPDLAGNQDRIVIDLSGDQSANLHLYLSKDSIAFRDNALHRAAGGQGNKSLVRRLSPGIWYVSVFCATRVPSIEDSVAGFYRTFGDRKLLQGVPYSLEVRQMPRKPLAEPSQN